MKTIRHRTTHHIVALLTAVGALLLANIASAKVHLKISANTEVIEAFTQWTATTPWEQINQYGDPHATRPATDLVLQLQALKAGGLEFDFEFVTTPNYERAKLEVVKGNADLSAETIWNADIEASGDALLSTDPVIRNGEFEKGIYVLPSNAKLLAVTNLEELQKYVAVIVGTWAVDLGTLEAMHLKGVEKSGKFENTFLMLDKQRADFTISEFSAKPDMSIELGGVTLIPVPQCKIAIAGNRAWIVCKASPNSAEIFAALQKGTRALHAEGRIKRALQECGFLNAKVANWRRLF